GDQPAVAHEELDGQNTAVAKVFEHTLEVERGAALPARRSVGSTGEPQDPATVDVAAQRVDGDLAPCAAGADDRHLAIELHVLFLREGHVPAPRPGAPGVRLPGDARLPLAVVAEPARLQHAGDADEGECPRQLAA